MLIVVIYFRVLQLVHARCFYRTKPVEKPKELIIPLIHKNRWYRHDAERGEKSSDDKTKDPSREEQDTVESQAVKELIEGVLLYYSFSWFFDAF